MIAKVFLTVVISLFFVQDQAMAQDTATMRDIPTAGSNNKISLAPKYHPEYKKLLDELERLQELQKTADDKSAALGRQRIDAAASRLNQYLLSGKPTVLPGSPQQSNGGSNNNTGSGNKASKTGNTVPSQHGKGGLSPIGSSSECSITFTYYEKFSSEGLSFIGSKSLDSGCGPYALTWNKQSFSSEYGLKSPGFEGSWSGEKHVIQGTLSDDNKSIKTITVKVWEDGYNTSGSDPKGDTPYDYHFYNEVTFTNLPLSKVKKEGKYNHYSFHLKGISRVDGTKLNPYVTYFLRKDGKRSINVDLVWNTEDKKVILDAYRTPEIKIEFYKLIKP